MDTTAALEDFLVAVRGQAHREGHRYAREGRVADLAVSGNLATGRVTGSADKAYDVALFVDGGTLRYRCTCPSWRDPCKHVVATATVLRSPPDRRPPGAGGRALAGLASEAAQVRDPGDVRAEALEERVLSARAEGARLRLAGGAWIDVMGSSEFPSRVTVRGAADGPHGCTCPDFEANRLHTCKHVERVRAFLGRRRKPLPREFTREAHRGRVYLHFGEVIEPRLYGAPRGQRAPAVRSSFDPDGLPLQPLSPDPAVTTRRLRAFGRHVEEEALAWLEARALRVPRYRSGARLRLSVPRRRGLVPYPYQREGALFLARRGRALLADEMGLGKTIQAILAALAMRGAERPVEAVTIVCPASLRGGWAEEIERWAGEQAELLRGSAVHRRHAIGSRPRWLITHYEQVLRDHAAHRAAAPDLLILDEAQRAKGLLAKTARVLKSIPSRHCFALTGTPLENRLEEAYAIAQLIDQRLLPPLWQLDRDHFVRDPERPRTVLLYRDLGALRSTLAPAFLRRRKEDVLPELPECIQTISLLPMHPDVEPTYEDAIVQVRRILRRKHLRPGDIERMQRLFVVARRCCNGPHMLGQEVADAEVPKLRELELALRELCTGEGRKVVVFSEWTDMTERVEALAKGLGVPTFHLRGSVPVGRRPAMIRAFTETDGPAVFVSTDAGGVGLNLQAADAVVNLDMPWNPARLAQRVARVHRIGSKGSVRVLLLVTQGSLEERMLSLHATKRDVLENVWSANGEDTIAAPGGSGALRDMLRTLLADALQEENGTAMARQEPDPAAPPESTDPWTCRPASGASLLLRNPGARAEARVAGTDALARSVAIAAAAAAPALPPEHRRSLAILFQALADALGEGAAAEASSTIGAEPRDAR